MVGLHIIFYFYKHELIKNSFQYILIGFVIFYDFRNYELLNKELKEHITIK